MAERMVQDSVPVLDLSGLSAAPHRGRLRFLFIHHSCGGQWLADPGPAEGEHCIYRCYPEGGALRHALQEAAYEVHEASYGSAIGNETDVFDWPDKFRRQMEQILTCDHQDVVYTASERNDVVAFKSCFPNNPFVPGGGAGNPSGPTLTVANAKAAYRLLMPEFARHSQVLFVCITAPPIASRLHAKPLWKRLARTALGRPSPEETLARSGSEARRFNNWLKSTNGWLKGYTSRNVVVFDLFDVLTDQGESNLSRYPTQDGYDSHPSRAGNEKATQAFVPFLNRAVRYAGLIAASDGPGNAMD